MTEYRPPHSYADCVAHNPGGGYLPVVCQSGSMGRATAPLTMRSSGTSVVSTGDPRTEEQWLDYSAAVTTALPAVMLPTATVASSTFGNSPPQSARGAKRRAMSSSTLSSDIPPDIMSLIRYSPTEIPAVFGSGGGTAPGGGGGRPTSSSTQFGARPGSVSHLSARDSASGYRAGTRTQHHHHQPRSTFDDLDLDNPLAAVIAMYSLEDQGGDADLLDAALSSNHAVVRQKDLFDGDVVDAAGCQQPSAAQYAALGGDFSGEMPTSGQEDLDAIEQLEQFLKIVDDVQCDAVHPSAPDGVAVTHDANVVDYRNQSPVYTVTTPTHTCKTFVPLFIMPLGGGIK